MFQRIKRWCKNLWLATSYGDRLAWIKEVMVQIEAIGDCSEVRTRLPEADERIGYLRERNVMAMPRIDVCDQLVLDYFTESKAEHLPPLLVFPILHSDARISPVAAYLQEYAQPGSYSSRMHMLVLGMDEKETPRFMATTLLHEIGHAMVAEKEGRILCPLAPRDERTRLEEELRMWQFDYQLAGFLGGEELRRYMELTAHEIIQGWVRGSPFHLKVGTSTPLDLCYGTISEQGSLGRRTVMYMRYCELIALRIFYGPLAHEHQLAFIASICQKSYKKQKDYIQSIKT